MPGQSMGCTGRRETRLSEPSYNVPESTNHGTHIMRFLLGAALAGCLYMSGGCTRTNAALMDNSVRLAPTCPDAVKLYTSPSSVGAPYKEIALLNSTGASSWTSEAGMMKSMRKKAADVGANGIIMGNIDEPGAGAKVAAAVFGTAAERKGKSLAIFVASDTARVSGVCAKAPSQH